MARFQHESNGPPCDMFGACPNSNHCEQWRNFACFDALESSYQSSINLIINVYSFIHINVDDKIVWRLRVMETDSCELCQCLRYSRGHHP